MRGYIQSAAHHGALSIARARNVSSIRPQMGWGGNPLSGGPATPSQPLNFNIATFNARRLWLSDHSVHDGFHMLVNLLTDENVDVLCVQEVFAGDFPSLLPNQPFTCDGPTSSRGREAGFLFRSGVSGFASRMHCPCAGEWVTTQCASVRSVQVCLRVSELHFGRSCSRVRGMCVPRPTFPCFLLEMQMCGIITSTSGANVLWMI